MATEYKLSYTASEIDKKLGKVDALSVAEERLTQEIALERARIDNLATLSEGSVTGDAELIDIRVGVDGQIYDTAGQSVRKQISQISEISEVIEGEDCTNLWTLGDKTITRYEKFDFVLPAGQYTFTMWVESTDTDHTVCKVVFSSDGTEVTSFFAQRNTEYVKTITLTQPIDKVEFCASNTYANAANDTATFSGITIIDNNAKTYTYIRTAKDDVAREGLTMANEDIEYIQNPNLYDGSWALGRYQYSTGAVFNGSETTSCRNVNPIILDPTKEYNVALKTEFAATSCGLYAFIYDENGKFVKYNSTPAGGIVHVSGASSINIHVTEYSGVYPDEPLHIMVWESNDGEKLYTDWLEYGEKGRYQKKNLVISEQGHSDAMLSRDKARFDDSFNYIAYSVVTGSEGSINTAEHFIWAAKQGFTALKGDVRPTSDGALIMCHDAGFSLDGNGYIKTYVVDTATPIHDLTEEQCLALQHNTTKQNVCSFDQYVKICKKYGKIAFITIRDEYIEEVVPAMFAILDKYNMRKRCIINSFTFESLRAVRNVDLNITLHQVLPNGQKISIAAINRAVYLGNCIISGFDFPNFGEYDDLLPEVLEYARKNDIRLYEGQINSMEHIDRLMEYGIAGAQMTVVPTL